LTSSEKIECCRFYFQKASGRANKTRPALDSYFQKIPKVSWLILEDFVQSLLVDIGVKVAVSLQDPLFTEPHEEPHRWVYLRIEYARVWAEGIGKIME
jgi:hypothetical protein